MAPFLHAAAPLATRLHVDGALSNATAAAAAAATKLLILHTTLKPSTTHEELSPLAEEALGEQGAQQDAPTNYGKMFLFFGVFVLAVFMIFLWCWCFAWSHTEAMVRSWSGFGGFIPKEEQERRALETARTQGTQATSDSTERRARESRWEGIKAIVFNRMNVLLIFVPVGWASHWLHWGDTCTFLLNLLAMLPLANIMGVATEELAVHTGQTVGGLLNATFGNAVELIVVVQSLRQGLLTVTKGTLLGSILANMLLVLGMAFLFGGLFSATEKGLQKNRMQKFYAPSAMVQAQLLLFSSFIIAMPSMFSQVHHVTHAHVVSISRVGSVFVLLGYAVYLFFQLYTHAELLQADEDEEDGGAIGWMAGIMLLIVATLLVAVSSEFMVHAIEGFTSTCGFSETFVGVVLLPIVGNACEHSTAVVVALKDKMDLAIGIALGSTIQIALFVVPFSVLAGWGFNQPMTLDFQEVNSWALVMSSLLVVCVLTQGTSNWLNGFLLVTAYCTLAILFFFSPDDALD